MAGLAASLRGRLYMAVTLALLGLLGYAHFRLDTLGKMVTAAQGAPRSR